MDIAKLMKSIYWNILLALIIFALTYFSAIPLGNFIDKYFDQGGTWLDLSSTIGFIEGFLFFLPFIFIGLGDKYSYYWLALFLVPVALFNLRISISVIYLPILLMFLGFLLGFTFRKLREKFWDNRNTQKTA